MSIIRVIHNRENPFVQLNKKALWDDRLSLKATGLWAKCLSRPDNWKFNIPELCKSLKEGKTAIYSAINELIKFGYAIRYQPSGKEKVGQKKLFQSVEYIFFEFPLNEQEQAEFIEELKKSFPRSGFPHAENQPILIKSIKEIEKKEEREEGSQEGMKPKKGASPPKPPPPPLLSFGSHVKLKSEDYETLCLEHGKEAIDDVIDTMNNKIDSGEKKPFKSYIHALKNWIKLSKKWEAKKSEKPWISPQRETNRDWSKRVKEKFKLLNSIFVGEQGITFYSGASQITIKYEEHGFKDKIMSIFRKMKLSVEGLE